MQYAYQILECDKTGRIVPNGEWFGFATKEDFQAGISDLAATGWKFGGLHPWHITPIDMIYAYREQPVTGFLVDSRGNLRPVY